jgi:hypothetical protein
MYFEILKFLLRIFFDMFVIVVKDYVLDIKFIMHLNHILNNSLIVWKLWILMIKYDV